MTCIRYSRSESPVCFRFPVGFNVDNVERWTTGQLTGLGRSGRPKIPDLVGAHTAFSLIRGGCSRAYPVLLDLWQLRKEHIVNRVFRERILSQRTAIFLPPPTECVCKVCQN